MRNAKPITLNPAPRRKADIERRIDAERSLTPIQDLPEMPALLKNHKAAAAEWRHLMQLYSELSAEVVSSLDLRLLVDYCLLTEQIEELDSVRAAAYALYTDLEKQQAVMARKKKKMDADKLAGSIGYIIDAVMKADARCDRKRDLLLKLSQSLYLTPRARAGYIPNKKPAPVSKDEMDEILDGVV